MTDSDQPLSPEEEEVRRLLAASRHTGVAPPEVVARLDRVLDDLSQEPDRAAPVVDLARRRRRVASLLVAAAAVVVVGIGAVQLVSTNSGSDTSTAGASRAQEDAGSDGVEPKSNPGAAESNDDPSTAAPRNSQGKSALVELRSSHLRDDLIRLRGLDASAQQLPLNESYRAGPSAADRAAGAACGAASWGRGRFLPVSYGGTPAVLVLRRPVGDTQVADIFLCGSRQPVSSVTLPAP